MTAKKKNRRVARSRRPTTARRIARVLPGEVEKIPVVKKTVRYLDGQEKEAEKTIKRWRKVLDKQRGEATKQVDRWLAGLGLVRLSVHEDKLKKARAERRAKKKTARKKTTSRTARAAA